jgi:hypothetical protein
MKLNASIAVTAVLVTGLVAVGCGSSNSSTTTTSNLSKAEWIAKADSICKASNDATNAAGKKQFGNKQPTNAQITAFVTGTVIPATQKQLDQIKALGPPTEQGSQAEAVVNAAQAELDKVKADPSLITGKVNPFAQVNQQAQAYGLKVCGKGGKNG